MGLVPRTFMSHGGSIRLRNMDSLLSSDAGERLMSASKSLAVHFAMDWAATIIVAVGYVAMEFPRPFMREFSLDNPSIQHPFAEHQRVPDFMCIVLAQIIPGLIMLLFPLFLRHRHRFHLIHISLLGFVQAFVLNGFLTNIFKIWIGNPRPDFLDRCKPAAGTPIDKLVTVAVCTATDKRLLYDGFKSTPSGHSSDSFAGQVYFAMFLAAQLSAFKPGSSAWRGLVCLIYVAITRLQDYRHHWYDIVLGSLLGTTVAYINYRRHFPAVTDDRGNLPYKELLAGSPGYSSTDSDDESQV